MSNYTSDEMDRALEKEHLLQLLLALTSDTAGSADATKETLSKMREMIRDVRNPINSDEDETLDSIIRAVSGLHAANGEEMPAEFASKLRPRTKYEKYLPYFSPRENTNSISRAQVSLPHCDRPTAWLSLCEDCKCVFDCDRTREQPPCPIYAHSGALLFGYRTYEKQKLWTATSGGCLMCSRLVQGLKLVKEPWRSLLDTNPTAIIYAVPSEMGKGQSFPTLPTNNEEFYPSSDRLHNCGVISVELQVVVDAMPNVDTPEKWIPVTTRVFELHPVHKLEHTVTRSTLPDCTFSENSLALSATWIANCISNHNNCQKPASGPFWHPSRLLELVIDDNFVNVFIRDSNFESLPYATLSYCWGQDAVLRLTNDNLEAMKTCIPPNKIPRTIQDAIRYTAQFGLRYLWVDSLCIIQDFTEDWQKEAAQMSKIYTRGIVNIATPASDSADAGTVFTRSPEDVQPTSVWLNLEGAPIGLYNVFDPRIWMENIVWTPLNNRAWVLQERLLAPRTIHAAEQQIFWECRELCACETYPGGLPGGPTASYLGLSNARYRKIDLLPSITPQDIQNTSNNDDLDRYRIWRSVVTIYSQCGITRSDDKLLALSGLAQHFEEILKDRYLAGLWHRVLVHDLLWHRKDRETQPSPRVSPYRAPTWSWASITGLVDYSLPDRLIGALVLVDIESANIGTVAGNRTGQVSGGEIRVSGLVCPESFDETEEGLNLQRLMSSTSAGSYCNFDVPGPPFSFPIFFLPLLSKKRENHFYGLILSQKNGGDGLFERVGLFSTSSKAFRGAVKVQTITLI